MDCQNISLEIDLFSNSTSKSINVLKNLNKFYESIQKSNENYLISTKKDISILIEEFQNQDNFRNSVNKKISNLFEKYNEYIGTLSNITGKLVKDIIEPMEQFNQNTIGIFKENQNEFKNISIEINEAKINLEKIKVKYYDYCKKHIEQENHITKLKNKIIGVNPKIQNTELENAHDLLLKLKCQCDNYSLLYNYEISKMNHIIEQNEETYKVLNNKIRVIEESRLFFLKNNLGRFSKIFEEFTLNSFDFLNNFNSEINDINLNEDLKYFFETFKIIPEYDPNNSKFRFKHEEFVSYEEFLKNITENPALDNLSMKNNELIKILKENDEFFNNDLQNERNKNNNYNSIQNDFKIIKFNEIESNFKLIESNNLDSKVKENYNFDKNMIKSSILDLNKQIIYENKEKSIFDDFEFIADSQYFSDDYQKKMCKKFLNEISCHTEIDIELMGKIMDILYNNPSFAKVLIDNTLIEKRNPVLVFKNFHNMQHYANILNSISINLDNHENENYELNFAVIHIAERSYFSDDNSGNKFYLSGMLSKNKLFSSKNYWTDLIELKFFKKLDLYTKKLQVDNTKLQKDSPITINKNNSIKGNSLDFSKSSNTTTNGNMNTSINKNIKLESGSISHRGNFNSRKEVEFIDKNILSNISNKFINFFNIKDKDVNVNAVKNTPNFKYDFRMNNPEEDFLNHLSTRNINNNENIRDKKSSSMSRKEKLDKDDLIRENYYINLLGSHQKIQNFYLNTNKEKKNLIENYISFEINLIIKEFIPHFANFNYEPSDAMDLLIEICSKYRLQKENISYYVTFLNSSYCSIKNKIAQKIPKGYEISKPTSKKKNFKDEKLHLIYLTSYYLDVKSTINLIQFNKDFYGKYKKKILSHILKRHEKETHSTNFNRIEIWRSILKIKILKKNIIYKELLDKIHMLLIDKSIENDELRNVKEIIDLDINRTHFETNLEENRKAITNILKAIAYVKPKINYCQGMNYIASFLFQLIKDEEETFFMMYGLFENTDFSHIFVDDLFKLKQYFYAFDRLINLYLPELHFYFKTNSVIVNYFTSSWFITLFTNSIQFLSPKETPMILLHIWDEFLINGWISMLKAGLALLKNYETTLLQLKYEDLLHFLINDMLKSGFFFNKNYNNYIYLEKKFKIDNSLLNNLESENVQEMKIIKKNNK